MNRLLLLLSALTGLIVFSSATEIPKQYKNTVTYYFYGKLYDAVYVDVLDTEVAVCFGSYFSTQPAYPSCIKIATKVGQAITFDDDTTLAAGVKGMHFPTFGAPTSMLGIRISSTDGEKMELYLLTSGQFSGVVFLTSGTSTFTIFAAEKGNIHSAPGTPTAAHETSACRDNEDQIVLVGNRGNCKTGKCQKKDGKLQLETPQACSTGKTCVEGACKFKRTCTFTGPSVIDVKGKVHTIKDRCTYVLVKSTKLSGKSVTGEYRERRRTDHGFLYKVIVTFDSVKYELEQGGIFKKDGVIETIPAEGKLIDGIQVSSSERGLLLSYTETDYDHTIRLFFNGYGAQIDMTGDTTEYLDTGLGGLCAAADSVADRTVTAKCNDVPKEAAEPTSNCPVNKKICAVLKNAPFTKCHGVVNPDRYVKACEAILCSYPSVDNMPCQFLEAYARDCEHSNVKVEGWRANSGCPATPKALCKGISCSPQEYCGQDKETKVWSCLCRPIFVKDYRKDKTLGKPAVCAKDTGKVSLVNCLLREKGIDYTKLHLNDASCGGTLSGDMVTFEFTATNMCGTKVENSATKVTYENTIQSADITKEVVVRQDVVTIDLSCELAQPKVQTLELTVTTKSVSETITSGNFDYKVAIAAFTDAALSTPATSVKVNSRIFLQLKTTGLDSALVKVVVDSCWATKDKEGTQPKYFLVKERCPSTKDKTVSIKGNGEGTSAVVAFNTFLFPKHKTAIFLHCKVNLCGVKKGETCVKDCTQSGRKRRSVRFMEEDPSPALITMSWTQ